MIRVEQARRLIEKNVAQLRRHSAGLAEALDCVLADRVCAPISLPVFDNSAMDGFALRSGDIARARRGAPVRLRIEGVIRAGDRPAGVLRPGGCCRIMTGSAMPVGADTVVPFEEAESEGGFLLLRHSVSRGQHVRRKGEEVRKGEKVLNKGERINPGTVALLASLGLAKVPVIRKPAVALIATGDELVYPGQALRPGKIYDSNLVMLAAALRKEGYETAYAVSVPDDPGRLKNAFRKALKAAEIVVVMGGVSAGDYDFVKQVFDRCGVRKIFWKVSQKPGKPLYLGKHGKKLVWGLPGNPGAVFTCFYEYVLPSIRAMSGCRHYWPERRILTATKRFTAHAPNRLVFLRGRLEGDGRRVRPLDRQGSHMISTLHETDHFIIVPPGRGHIRKGEKLKVDFPFSRPEPAGSERGRA